LTADFDAKRRFCFAEATPEFDNLIMTCEIQATKSHVNIATKQGTGKYLLMEEFTS